MTFFWPHALWMLVLLPALVGAYFMLLRRKARIPFVYSAVGTVREAMDLGDRLRRHAPPAILLLGAGALLLAVARPAAVTIAPSARGTVVLAIDVSLSMAADDVVPTRLAAAQAAARAFIEAQPAGVLIGIVAFAGHADVVQSPTANRSELMAALHGLKFRRYTSLGNGMIAALLTIRPDASHAVEGDHDVFGDGRRPAASRNAPLPPLDDEKPPRPVARGSDLSSAIVLVSDGQGALGVPPMRAAKVLAAHGVRVYTIGIGTPYGGTAHVEGMPPLHADFEEDTLQKIADLTGGDYFHTRTAEKVKSVYEKLATRVVLEKKESEITALLGAIGAVLSLAAAALSLLWWSPLLR